MEGNKGITLITLIITIVLMIILASVTITYGMQIYENNKIHKFVAQLQMIQKKVDNYAEDLEFLEEEEREEKIEADLSPKDSEINEGRAVSDIISDEGLIGDINDFKYFTSADLEDKFQIDNIDEKTIVFAINFKTREVINTTGEEYNDIRYYTQYKNLPGSQNLIQYAGDENEIGFTCNLEDVKCLGLNSKIVVKNIEPANTVLSYGLKASDDENDISWSIKSNHTIENEIYEISVSKAGTYRIKAEDVDGNIKEIEVEIVLNNSPKLDTTITPIDSAENGVNTLEIETGSWYNYKDSSEKWAFAKDTSSNGKVYVWIPRFIYNESTGEIKYLKGNSNVPTDDEDVQLTAGSNWRLPNEFGTYPNAVTGIWVEITNSDNRNNLRPSIKDIFTDGTFGLSNREILVID